jgi:hypothetical protein
MTKPNYAFDKRQRGLAKKKKKEEKRLKGISNNPGCAGVARPTKD